MFGFSIPLILFGVTAVIFPLGTGNMLFSATIQLQNLLITQKGVIEKLNKFIDAEETLFLLLKRFQDKVQIEYDHASRNEVHYLENPINSYKLIKKLTADIGYIMEKLDIFGMLNSTSTLLFPVDTDLQGACQALISLQETYQLSTDDMAAGILINVTHSSPMLSGDCFALARVLYNIGQYHFSNLWFKQTLNKLNEDKLDSAKARRYVYEFLANNNYNLGDLEEGLSWLDKIAAEFSKNELILKKEEKWKKELDEKRSSEQPTLLQDRDMEKDFSDQENDEKKRFQTLCRSGSQLTEDVKKRLICRYDTAGPYLKIAPFKVEEAYLNPDIMIFHKVLSNAEIVHLKALARNKLEPSRVTGSDAEGKAAAKLSYMRISQVSWIQDSEDRITERVSRRAGHMSHLSIETAELAQVSIYGMGGYYLPHHDALLSDELLGGATVFTKLGVYVAPLEGAAVVWRNLLPSTEPDLRNMHGACPVLLGSKWVLSKWIRAVGQEFISPCSLTP